MHLTERQHRIVRILRYGPLDQYQIAADLGSATAPFTVRGELQALRRERLVRFSLTEDSVLWKLTEQGMKVAWSDDPLTIDGAA